MSLRLESLTLREVRIPFRFGFRHARAERKVSHSLIVEVKTNAGDAEKVGYGEILPREYLTGETIESCFEEIERRFWPKLARLDLDEEEPPFSRLWPIFKEADEARLTASYAGLDLAIFDAWARALDLPLLDALTKKHGSKEDAQDVRLTAPIGLGMPVGVVARFFRSLGFDEFKVKVGGKDDLEVLRSLRQIIGPERGIRVDANEAFDAQGALALAEQLVELGVSSMEQPVPGRDFEGMARVQDASLLPVCADESLCNLDDAHRLLACRGAAIWNLRLLKVGGFTGLKALLDLAREHGISCQLGVLVGETSLSAAAERVAATLYPFLHVEYGFPGILLGADPFTGAPPVRQGRAAPPGRLAGLGVSPVARYLDKFTVRAKVLEAKG